MKFYKKEEYVYMDCSMRLSTKQMSDVMYAAIMCYAYITNHWCLCYEYDRKQNCHNNALVKIHIHPDQITKFNEMSGCKLKTPQSVTVNSTIKGTS